jgi:hypothetical protein
MPFREFNIGIVTRSKRCWQSGAYTIQQCGFTHPPAPSHGSEIPETSKYLAFSRRHARKHQRNEPKRWQGELGDSALGDHHELKGTHISYDDKVVAVSRIESRANCSRA